MNDKERIEYLIRLLNITNVEFAAKVGVSPATLSHITSGRSKPTLAILRGIINAYPDLNPEWVLMGEGDVKRHNVEVIDNTVSATEGGAQQPLAFQSADQVSGKASGANMMASLVGATQMKQRKVVEIRVFFDDGTYQEFN